MNGIDSNLISEQQIERLRDIFDRNRKIESDEDLLRLAELVNDENAEDLPGGDGQQR